MKELAFKTFDSLKLGQSIIISEFAKRDPVSFKNYAIEYINECGGLVFNNDYSIVTKCESFEDVKKMGRGINIILTYNRQ